jgi:hypothetical protein
MISAPSAAPTASPQRFLRGRTAWTLLYSALVLIGAFLIVGRHTVAWNRAFVLGPVLRVAIGDQIQTAYYLWLWAHSLSTLSHPPWIDPFQFAATGHTTVFVTGWPLAIVSVPLEALAGPIAAFNGVVYASFLAAAWATYLFVRELRGSRAAGAVAGFAFAFAPFRLMQAGHVNSMISFLLPLTLFFAERALRSRGARSRRAAWGCAASFLSIVASGELHVLTFTSVVLAGYVLVRSVRVDRAHLRSLWAPAAALVVASAVLGGAIYVYVFAPSSRAGQSGISQAPMYAPHLADFFSRRLVRGSNPERYAYPGIVIVALALLGVVAVMRRKADRLLGAYLALLVAGSMLLAVLPGVGGSVLQKAYKSIPALGFSRVPGRILLVSVLVLAVFAGFAVDGLRDGRWTRALAAPVLVAAMVLLVLDPPHGYYFRYSPAGDDPLYRVPKGASVLDLPAFGPHNPGASRIELYLLKNHGPRAGGYNELATPEIDASQVPVLTLNDPKPDPCTWKRVTESVRVSYVAVHMDLYGKDPIQYPADGAAVVGALDRMAGFKRLSFADNVVVYKLDRQRLSC